jgi:hypothetical protein
VHGVRSRRVRRHGVALAVTLALISVATASTARAVPNPDVTSSPNGFDVVLVLDASGTVRYHHDSDDANGAVDAVADAATAFLRAFSGTGTRAALVSYAMSAHTHVGLVDLTTASLAPGGAHARAIGDPGGRYGPLNKTTGYSEHARTGAGSNWEAGLAAARQLLRDARAGVPTLVVHVTDGQPTAHLGPDGRPVLGDGDVAHVDEAARVADELKTAGTHVFAVGIGDARRHAANLVRTAGPDVFDQRDRTDSFDPTIDDVILTGDFARLEHLLSRMAAALESPTTAPPPVPSEAAPGSPQPSWLVMLLVPLVLLPLLLLARRNHARRVGRTAPHAVRRNG